MTSFGSVLKAHCNCKCPAGIDGRCNHVASTLFALEHFKNGAKLVLIQRSPVHPSLVSGMLHGREMVQSKLSLK